MNPVFRPLTLVAALVATASAHAFTDAPGDILQSFTGDRTVGAFDILSSDVTFDAGANVFLLHAHTAGNISDVASAGFVFGFNRGGATNSPFTDIGVPGVTFDATALLRANGTGLLGANPLVVSVNGQDIFATVSASLLPPNGFAPQDFTWALWSIDSQIQGNFRNADFAPEVNMQVTAVPEPETYALMLAGLGVMGFVGRRRAGEQLGSGFRLRPARGADGRAEADDNGGPPYLPATVARQAHSPSSGLRGAIDSKGALPALPDGARQRRATSEVCSG